MGYSFGERSKENLRMVHPSLIKLCYEVIKNVDFTVIEGYRSTARQKELYEEGLSQIDGETQKSNHNYKPSLAIDVIPYEKGHNPFDGSEKSELMFYRLYREFHIASKKLDIPIGWGGLWENFKDFPHIELS